MKVEQVTSIVSHTSVGPSICGNPLALRRVIGHIHTLTCVPLKNGLVVESGCDSSLDLCRVYLVRDLGGLWL